VNITSTKDDQTSRIDSCALLIDGAWETGAGDPAMVLDKYTQQVVAKANAASDSQIGRMITAANKAFRKGAPVAYERGAILDRAANLVARDTEDFIRVIQAEAGFTRSDAMAEVNRCMQTLRLSADEARRLAGEMVPMEGAPGQSRRLAFTLRVPLGVVLCVTPFNSPLNTVTHKVAPAFAAGNSVVVKPSSSTPMTTCRLAETLVEAGLPHGFLSVLHGGGAVVQHAISDQRVRFIAFTGSTEVGRLIQSAADLRRTQMELGSIAFTILNDDADLDLALPKIVGAGYRKAGQVCTSVQMLLVHASLVDTVKERMKDLVSAVKYGDPRVEGTVTGPLITEGDAIRVETWIDEAIGQGATCLVGGPRQGPVVPPTLLCDVTTEMKVASQEIFGPVICIVPFDTLEDAIDQVNATPFGLASGIFTNRLSEAFEVVRQLEVGGVHINETSSSRVDLMPYGGSKDSGFGREGPQYSIREMTEERIVSIST